MRPPFTSLVAAAVLAAPSSAAAATATITETGGQPQPLSAPGPTVRDLGPTVSVAFDTSSERRYSLAITGPSGTPVARPDECLTTASPASKRVEYQGNGAYVVVVRTFPEDDANCAGAPKEERSGFTIAGGAAIGAPIPGALLLTRRAGTSVALEHLFPVAPNPGADRHEIRFARNGRIGADGGIAGASSKASLTAGGDAAAIRFSRPGRYVVVIRAGETTSAGTSYTPWSAPLTVRVLAPFDFSIFGFPDARGPSYRLRGVLRESGATGRRVTIALSRGGKGRFRTIGRPRISRAGGFALRFRIARRGSYRLRVRFAGTSLIAGGQYTDTFRIRGTS